MGGAKFCQSLPTLIIRCECFATGLICIRTASIFQKLRC